MSSNNPLINITAIHVDAHSQRIKVSIEIDDRWVEILNEHHTDTMHTSHIIEANGMRSRVA